MTQKSMAGIAITVDDLEAAGETLSSMGMSLVATEIAGQSVWVGGNHFLVLKSANSHRPHQPEYVVYLSGEGDDFSVAGIEFRHWGAFPPAQATLETGRIMGIDHVIAMVGSIEQAGRELQSHCVVQSEAIREFPSISTLARMFLIGDAYIEFNEPLGDGTPAWGTRSGIVGLVLQTDNIEQFRTRVPSANISRTSQVQAREPGGELETLGVVSLVKTRAFGDFQIFVFEAWRR